MPKSSTALISTKSGRFFGTYSGAVWSTRILVVGTIRNEDPCLDKRGKCPLSIMGEQTFICSLFRPPHTHAHSHAPWFIPPVLSFQLSASSNSTTPSQVSATLDVRVTKVDNGQDYRCQVSHPAWDTPKNTSVRFSVLCEFICRFLSPHCPDFLHFTVCWPLQPPTNEETISSNLALLNKSIIHVFVRMMIPQYTQLSIDVEYGWEDGQFFLSAHFMPILYHNFHFTIALHFWV